MSGILGINMLSGTISMLAVLGQAPSQPQEPFGWKGGVEHRFVWVQGGKRVGETRFQILPLAAPASEKGGSEKGEAARERTPKGGSGAEEGVRAKEKGTRGDDGPSAAEYRIEASRTYDREGTSHRATGVTTVRADGAPLRYEEKLDVSTFGGKQSHQETYLRCAAGKATVRYLQNGAERPPIEQDLPPGSFLTASQAVEHWAIFLSKLPPAFEKKEVQLFYPDFARMLQVTFKKGGAEKLRIGKENVETTRYTFVAQEANLRGTVWLDSSRRLLQIEFPNPASSELALRVALSP